MRKRCAVEGCNEPRITTAYCVIHQGFSPRLSFSGEVRVAGSGAGAV